MTRRELLGGPAALLLAQRAHAGATKMKIHLTCGSVNVKADQLQGIEYAAKYGFDAAEPQAAYFAGLSNGEIDKLTADVKKRGLVWGGASLGVDFRKDDAAFKTTLADLPKQAQALQWAGITRMGTWIAPAHDTLTYTANMKTHATRLGECARIVGHHGIRLGLEYVAPKTLWTSRRFAFVHTMAEMRDLHAAINEPNVGFVLDSWHWYTAGETVADLRTLTNKEIVSCDLNDAPVNVSVDQQIDSKRELPLATGVIDLAGFLNTLNELGYDGPIRCEPFNATLRAMTPEQILPVVIASMRKAFALVR